MSEARLRPATVRPGDRYGAAVALLGNRLYVAAPFTPIPGDRPHVILGRGLIYSFNRRGGGWQEGDLLRAPGSDFFGSRLDVFPGGLVAGAPHPAPEEAAAFVLRGAR
jgi:hypothetical protein